MPKDNYNASYYQRNKGKLLKQKQDRYQNDPDYRERLKKSRQKAYAKKQKAKAALGDYVVRVVNGKSVKVLKVGVVLAKLGITNTILGHWEKTGVVPEADGRYGKARCYTDNQYRCLKHVASLRATYGYSIHELKTNSAEFIEKYWNKGD